MVVPALSPRSMEMQLLKQVPLAVRFASVIREGYSLSSVQYRIVVEAPGLDYALTKDYGDVQQLHLALGSGPCGQLLPLLPNLGAFETFRSLPLQTTALERLRVQL